jgi:hypothetical protein
MLARGRFDREWNCCGIGLINNEGIGHPYRAPVQIDPSKTQRVTVQLKHGTLAKARKWCLERDLSVRRNGVTLEIPPGEVRIVELTL